MDSLFVDPSPVSPMSVSVVGEDAVEFVGAIPAVIGIAAGVAAGIKAGVKVAVGTTVVSTVTTVTYTGITTVLCDPRPVAF